MKKALKIIIAIIVVVAVIVGGIFAYKFISTNKTKEKISQINAEELETKLIEELKKTKLNVGTIKGIKNVDIKKIDGYISVFVNGDGDFDFINIPVLKVDSNNSSNFKGIEYIPVFYFGEYIDIESLIFNVLENEFSIKGLDYKNREKLIKHNTNTLTIDFVNDETLLLYINEINTRADYQNINELEEPRKTDYFGI